MENKLKVAQEFVNNSIPNQELSYANQLTVKQWNDIINVLRVQTNTTTNYLRQLHSWLIGINNTEDYAVVEDGLNLYTWIKTELQNFENYIKNSFITIGDEVQTITGKKIFKHFVSDKILPETEYGMLGDGYNQFSTAHIKEVITDSIVPIVSANESGVSGSIGKEGLYWNEAFINGIHANNLVVNTITLNGDDLIEWTRTHVQTKISELRKELYEIDSDGVIDSIKEITKALEEGGDYYEAFVNMINERALKTDFEKHVNDMNQLFEEHIEEFEGHLEDSNERIEEVNTNIEMHRQNKEWIVDAEGNGAWVKEDNPHDVDKGQMPLFDTWADNIDSTLNTHAGYINANTSHRNTVGNPHRTGIDDISGLKEALQEGTKGNKLIEAHIKNEVDDNGNILTDGSKNNNPHKVTHEQVIGLANRLNELEENIKAYVKDGTLIVRIKKGDSTATYNFTANQETQTGIEFGIPVKVEELEDAADYAKKIDIGDGVHTITVNGETISEFRANSPDNITADIIVPTKVEELDDHDKYPRLDEYGKIPSDYLPGYVDDVLEFDTFDDFPKEGDTGKIYVDKSKNNTYRWSGTQYIKVGGANIAEFETQLDDLDKRVDKLEEDVVDLQDQIDNIDIGKADLIIKVNNTPIGTFNANQSGDSVPINISVPRDTSELNNDAGFITKDDIPADYVTEGELNTALSPYTANDIKHTNDIDALKKAINNLVGGGESEGIPDNIPNISDQIGTGNLVITYNGVDLGTFNANHSGEDVVINIPKQEIEIPEIDLKDYVKKNDNITLLSNNAGYITLEEVPKDLSKYDNTTSDFVNTQTVDTKIKALKDELFGPGSTDALDTINEIAAALEAHEDAYDALLETVGAKINGSGTVEYIPIFTKNKEIGDSNISRLSTGEVQIWRTITASDNEVALKLRSNHSDSLIHFADKNNKRLGYFGFIGGDLGYYRATSDGGLASATMWHSANDGAGSGLDADLLDGQQGAHYLDYNNFTNVPNATINITAGKGLITGGSFTLNQTTSTDIVINIASSTLSVTDNSVDLATSGVTEGTYGKDQTPSHSGTFTIPKITVDKYGRITSVSTASITLPADENTDSDQKTSSAATTDKIYLVGAKEKSSGGITTNTNDGVYAMNNGILGSKQVRVDSSTTGSTKACIMQYDESINALKFVFA